MSTRCNVTLFDYFDQENPGCNLYHHSDGYPEFMMKKLVRFLKASYDYLKEANCLSWWNAEKVGAVLILLSVEDYEEPLKPFSTDRPNTYKMSIPGADKPYRPNSGLPTFQPCVYDHGDIEYLWKVFLEEKGEFKIQACHPDGTEVPKEEIPEEYHEYLKQDSEENSKV